MLQSYKGCSAAESSKRRIKSGMNAYKQEESNMDLMQAFTAKYVKEEPPVANVGDTVRVHVRVKEGSRERIQVFEGTVIAKKHGGIDESITVRRVSYGVGVSSPFTHLRWKKLNWCAGVRCAGRSSIICVIVWVRALSSRRSCKNPTKRSGKSRSFFAFRRFLRWNWQREK